MYIPFVGTKALPLSESAWEAHRSPFGIRVPPSRTEVSEIQVGQAPSLQRFLYKISNIKNGVSYRHTGCL
jgi:hypothetical protein